MNIGILMEFPNAITGSQRIHALLSVKPFHIEQQFFNITIVLGYQLSTKG